MGIMQPIIFMRICTGSGMKWEAETSGVTFMAGDLLNTYLRACRKPIAAAVKDYAIGGGNHLACCCDFTIAADNAIFGQNSPLPGSPVAGLGSVPDP